MRRLPERHDRRYVSIFGELTIDRVVYGTREGQKIERVPLDERLGLPEGDFSYVLEDWGQRLCLKGSFAEAGQSLEMLLGLRVGEPGVGADEPGRGRSCPVVPGLPGGAAARGGRPADGRHRRRQGGADAPPEPEDGPRPHHRRTKGEKANKKQMACVGAVYSIEPFVRKAEDIIDEVLRDEKAEERPRPQHKHVWAEMTREVEGEPPVTAKEGLFCHLTDELTARNLGHDRPVICLMDGERALWDAQAVYFPEAVGVLDLFHVLERLWAVAHCFHKEGSDEAKEFVEQRLRDLLQGRVGYVISGLRRRLKAEKLSGQRRKVVRSALEYLGNNKAHMRYDEYLAAGYSPPGGFRVNASVHRQLDPTQAAYPPPHREPARRRTPRADDDRRQHPLRDRREHPGHRPRRHRGHPPPGPQDRPDPGHRREPPPAEAAPAVSEARNTLRPKRRLATRPMIAS